MPSKSKLKCWVWLKGSSRQDCARWESGWVGIPSDLGGIRIEHPDYVSCRVPDWRVSWEEPADLKVAPKIPDDTQWKLIPTG
ncbi:hypothetical protein [Synechococcus sp. M16CYN]|uniref:hypothetical protein n=1 Tax=Synechococcus sp. M16CYN TaxID=3103139 RepID=UPI00333FACBA